MGFFISLSCQYCIKLNFLWNFQQICVRNMSLKISIKLFQLELWNYYNLPSSWGQFSEIFRNHEEHIRDNLFFLCKQYPFFSEITNFRDEKDIIDSLTLLLIKYLTSPNIPVLTFNAESITCSNLFHIFQLISYWNSCCSSTHIYLYNLSAVSPDRGFKTENKIQGESSNSMEADKFTVGLEGHWHREAAGVLLCLRGRSILAI